MRIKSRLFFIGLCLLVLIGNILTFRLRASDHNSKQVNLLVNEVELIISELKNESLALMYLEKINFDKLALLTPKLSRNINDLAKLIETDTSSDKMYRDLAEIRIEEGNILSSIDLFKKSISKMRVSEGYLTRVFSEQINDEIGLKDLIQFVFSSKVEGLINIDLHRKRILDRSSNLNEDKYQALLVTLTHIDIFIRSRRSVTSVLNYIIESPLNLHFDKLRESYNAYTTVLNDGFTSLLKVTVAINSIFSLIVLIVFTRLRANKSPNKVTDKNDTNSVNDMTTIFSTFSHRIKNPMNGIMGMLSLLKGTSLTEEQVQYTEGIEYSSNHLSSLLHDLVEYSRLKASESKVNYKSINFNKKCEETFSIWRNKASQKGLKFILKIGQGFPEKLFLDFDKLEIVITNILDNAITYTEVGAIKIELNFTRIGEGHGKLQLKICDSGKGMESYDISTLINGTTMPKKNEKSYTGLGIAICYEMIKLMGGEIYFEKNSDGGTSVQIEMQAQIDNSLSSGSEDSSTNSILDCYRILVAEDEKINQKVIYGMLNKLNQEVTIVENGKELIEQFKVDQYDLIFVDMMMPEIDGLEATSILVEKFGDKLPPIIALSGNEKDKYLNQCLEVGMVDFISKPVKKVDLKNILLKYCKRADKVNVA